MATFNMSRIAGSMLAAAAVLALSAPLQAGSGQPQAVAVRYSDLDINTVQGARQLLTRIKQAADRACAATDSSALTSSALTSQCRLKLTSDAVARVNNPVVAAVYSSAHPSARTVTVLAE